MGWKFKTWGGGGNFPPKGPEKNTGYLYQIHALESSVQMANVNNHCFFFTLISETGQLSQARETCHSSSNIVHMQNVVNCECLATCMQIVKTKYILGGKSCSASVNKR